MALWKTYLKELHSMYLIDICFLILGLVMRDHIIQVWGPVYGKAVEPHKRVCYALLLTRTVNTPLELYEA
jgi:hypothetical protein